MKVFELYRPDSNSIGGGMYTLICADTKEDAMAKPEGISQEAYDCLLPKITCVELGEARDGVPRGAIIPRDIKTVLK